jgi:hypothetical protein
VRNHLDGDDNHARQLSARNYESEPGEPGNPGTRGQTGRYQQLPQPITSGQAARSKAVKMRAERDEVVPRSSRRCRGDRVGRVPDGSTPHFDSYNSDLIDYCMGSNCFTPVGTAIDPTAPVTQNVAYDDIVYATPLEDIETFTLSEESISVSPIGVTLLPPPHFSAQPSASNQRSLLSSWPLNGTIVPYTGQQDQKCSVPLVGPSMDSNPAILKCCQAHDNCYEKYSCNMTSWNLGSASPVGACKACNAEVAGCIGGSVFK